MRIVWSVTVAILKSIATGCLCVNHSNYGRIVFFCEMAFVLRQARKNPLSRRKSIVKALAMPAK